MKPIMDVPASPFFIIIKKGNEQGWSPVFYSHDSIEAFSTIQRPPGSSPAAFLHLPLPLVPSLPLYLSRIEALKEDVEPRRPPWPFSSLGRPPPAFRQLVLSFPPLFFLSPPLFPSPLSICCQCSNLKGWTAPVCHRHGLKHVVLPYACMRAYDSIIFNKLIV